MPQWTADELTALIGDEQFSETITYTPQNPAGVAAQIKAFVDWGSQALALAGMGEVSSYKALATCRTSDVPNAKKNDLVTARSVNYVVTDVNPDGTGITQLAMTKA